MVGRQGITARCLRTSKQVLLQLDYQCCRSRQHAECVVHAPHAACTGNEELTALCFLTLLAHVSLSPRRLLTLHLQGQEKPLLQHLAGQLALPASLMEQAAAVYERALPACGGPGGIPARILVGVALLAVARQERRPVFLVRTLSCWCAR